MRLGVKPHFKFYDGLWHCSTWLKAGNDVVESGHTLKEAYDLYVWWHKHYEFGGY